MSRVYRSLQIFPTSNSYQGDLNSIMPIFQFEGQRDARTIVVDLGLDGEAMNIKERQPELRHPANYCLGSWETKEIGTA